MVPRNTAVSSPKSMYMYQVAFTMFSNLRTYISLESMRAWKKCTW